MKNNWNMWLNRKKIKVSIVLIPNILHVYLYAEIIPLFVPIYLFGFRLIQSK